jgi:hypothetical protein
MIARDADLSLLGGAAQSVEIPDVTSGKLTLSSIFLSSSAATPSAPGSGDAEALRDVQTLRRFKRDESLYFQLYVYNVAGAAEGKSDVVLQAQILSGGNPIAASKPQPVTVERKDGMPLPQSSVMGLEGLAPGRYVLRIVVVDNKAKATVHRDLDFTVS